MNSYRTSQNERTNSDSPVTSGDSSSESAGFNYARFVALNDRVSVMFGGGGGMSRYKFNGDSSSTSRGVSVYLQAGFSASLWPERFTRRLGDLRWETRATYALSRSEGIDSRYFNATTAVMQRSVWGTLRFVSQFGIRLK